MHWRRSDSEKPRGRGGEEPRAALPLGVKIDTK